ncbi:pyridoxamine 5'-phosphate oxidase family protein [Rhodovarius crocodyli]|uniref:Pyridoxamine 5'-phosphate oxidase family protein n=1 Tax=Rhodovarius crocodyli TaxID=1979269 RepID=A0A437MPE2_9PROT|nr:pyridoxamine 5'-phosphate oxidase family protein [Rhodovarius crocodyli]RVT99495.1 pyridoxamine 5'-phosphate oxidase family protein [Rhodovarius crocodyli]
MSEAESYPVTNRNKVKRKPQRGSYDKQAVYDILDSAMICHIAYVIDGQPYCTPTSFWREGDDLIWHGSSASRMVRAQSGGVPVCLTVTHLDAVILARCGFNHSVNYRSVMAYGTAHIVDDLDEKHKLIDAFLDRFFPGRAATMRPATVQEVKATTFIRMKIDDASAKVRDLHIADDEEDYAWPAWTALYPVKQVIGPAEECPRQLPDVKMPEGMAGWTPGRKLDEVMLEMYREHYEK